MLTGGHGLTDARRADMQKCSSGRRSDNQYGRVRRRMGHYDPLLSDAIDPSEISGIPRPPGQRR